MLRPALIACGAGLVAVWSAVALLGDLRHGAFPGFALLYFAAAGLYLLALVAIRLAERAGVAEDRRALAGALGAALLMRLVLLPGWPSLSDDLWRYRWEGRVQLAGANPYATPPADPALAGLRDGEWLRVNHPRVPAVYGPPLQLLFAGLAAAPGGLLPFKLAFVGADLGVGLLLVRLLRRRGRPGLWALAWAWHPLPVLEVAGQGHLEVVPVCLLLLAVEREEAGRSRWAGLALGLAAGAKYLPLLTLPGFVTRGAGWRERAGRLGLVLGAASLPALPYLSAASAGGLPTYAASWRFNEGPFGLLDQALWRLGASPAFARAVAPLVSEVPPGLDPARDWAWSQALAKLLVGALVLALVGRAARRGVGPAGTAALAGGLFLALSPTVHPWYALWVLPFLVLVRAGPAWLWLSLALPLSYEVLLRYDGTPGSWVERPWVRACVWLPWAVLLLASGVARGRLSGTRDALPPGDPSCAVGCSSSSSSCSAWAAPPAA